MKQLEMKLKYSILVIIWFFYSTLFFGQIKRVNDGVDKEIAITTKSSSTKIDESSGFKVKGTINYTIPKDLQDGIRVADANNSNVNIKQLMKTVNEIEENNKIYKAKLDKGIPRQDLRKEGCIDSFLLYNNGELILEEYFGFSSIDKPHFQMSITKSIASYAIGIAIDQHKIESEEDYILKYLPEIDTSRLSDNTKKIKLKDVLSMQSGIELDKDFILSANGKNLVSEILQKSNTIQPGTTYKYQGVNPEIIVQILKNTTGKDMKDYVDEYLFKPLGIKDYSFDKSPNGLTKAAAGMKLRSRDMLKIGILALQLGKYNGQQIISKNWVKKANDSYVDNGKHKYGYFWWTHYVDYKGTSYKINSCRGALGQFIYVIPQCNAVAVFTSNGTRKAFSILENVVIPSIVN